jgi:hypothetical protein
VQRAPLFENHLFVHYQLPVFVVRPLLVPGEQRPLHHVHKVPRVEALANPKHVAKVDVGVREAKHELERVAGIVKLTRQLVGRGVAEGQRANGEVVDRAPLGTDKRTKVGLAGNLPNKLVKSELRNHW